MKSRLGIRREEDTDWNKIIDIVNNSTEHKRSSENNFIRRLWIYRKWLYNWVVHTTQKGTDNTQSFINYKFFI